MNSFRTEIHPHTTDFTINHQDGIMLNGSCFSENIGALFQRMRFNVNINSHGIIFNPESLAYSLDDLINVNIYSESDLGFHNNVFHSIHHHGRFNHASSDVVLETINSSIRDASQQLRNAKLLFVTFGSAWIYRLKKSSGVVANCHKLPGSDFDKSLMSHQEIEHRWRDLLKKLFVLNDKLQIVLTVSPVRHWRDGFSENQLSKANLLIAVNALCVEFKNVHYFPSYELVMDDLRDYRFYNSDMLHPNATAIDYIWQKLAHWCFDRRTKELLPKLEPLVKFIEHKPMNTDIARHSDLVKTKLDEIVRLIGSI